MTIAVLGGTGKTGRLIVSRLLNAGHKVRVLARDPDKIAPAFGLEMIKGNALDGGKIMLTLTGCQGVVCVLGNVKGNPDGALTQATRLLLAGMDKLGVKRVLAITSLGVGDSSSQVAFPYNLLMKILLKKELADKAGQEQLLVSSQNQWTIIRPSGLTDLPGKGAYRTGTDNQVKGTKISRSDLAEFTVSLIENPESFHKTYFITE